MKKLPLILSCLLGTLHVHAQDWRPLQPGYVYQYDDPTGKYYSQNSGLNHLKVVSKTTEGSDSVYYLNTAAIIVKPSAAHLDYLTKTYTQEYTSEIPNSGLLVNNQPYFLDKKVRISGADWIFEGDDRFVLKPGASKGDTWTFSASRSITAEVTDIRQETFFGVTDDVKIITLSTGEIIKLSKNHGIISFPSFNGGGNYYSLKGVEGPDVGVIVPQGKRVYDFQPGDIFQYYHKVGNPFEQGEYVRQVIIQARYDYGSSVSYKTREITVKNGKVSLATKTLQFALDGSDPVNLYPGEITSVAREAEGHDYAITQGRNGRHTQNRTSYFFWDRAETGSDTLFPFKPIVCVDWKSDYAAGLGKTYDYEYGMGGMFEIKLTAFRKTDGSKMGTMLTIDTTLGISETIANGPTGLSIYPNPAKGETITLTSQLSRPGVLQCTLTDLQGRIIVASPEIDLPSGDFSQPLNIGQVSPGIYLLRLNGAGVSEVMKVNVVR